MFLDKLLQPNPMHIYSEVPVSSMEFPARKVCTGLHPNMPPELTYFCPLPALFCLPRCPPSSTLPTPISWAASDVSDVTGLTKEWIQLGLCPEFC